MTARLVRKHLYPTRGAPEYFVFDMQLLTTLRGQIPASFRLYQGNDSGRLPVDWMVGRSYLLFLFSFSPPVPHAKSAYAVDGCGNSGPLPQVRATLRRIEASRTSTTSGGVISGAVGDGSFSWPVRGAEVTATGEGTTFHAVTDRNGRFELRVPAGNYDVKASRRKTQFKPLWFSYENPQRVTIEDGGCAQLQFTRTGD